MAQERRKIMLKVKILKCVYFEWLATAQNIYTVRHYLLRQKVFKVFNFKVEDCDRMPVLPRFNENVLRATCARATISVATIFC